MDDWKQLLSSEMRDFIISKGEEDVAALGLKRPPEAAWPYTLILDQIKARQKAKAKMPEWHAAKDIVFPPASLIEQASSEATARYKASLFKGTLFADLTAGAGMDFAALLKNFEHGIAVEKNKTSSEILSHNLNALGFKNFEVLNKDAENEIENIPSCDLVYIDPQRRSENTKGLFRFEDCSPNILKILPQALKKAGNIAIKASPMLDIDQGIRALSHVTQVHVIEWRGECREVIYILKPDADEAYITPVIIDDNGNTQAKISFTRAEESNAISEFNDPLKYIYEPSPAFQKAGCYKFLGTHYGLKKLHPHTHLFTSDAPCPNFPGRVFEVVGLYPASGKDLPFDKANLTVRNFPASADELRNKLKLKDGGNEYLFACTRRDEGKILIHARKSIKF
jgi:16S rRNA G966 N2-methylase RsmD